MWRPIDSNVTNARKCLEVKQYESLYEEITWKIFVERNKGVKEEWKVIWKIILVRHPWGPRRINRRYEHIDIQSLLEPRDDTPAKEIEIEKMSVTLETMRKDYKNDEDINMNW